MTTLVLLATIHTSAASSAEPLQLEVILIDAPTRLIGSFSTSDGEHISATRQELKDLGVVTPGGGSPAEVIGLDNVNGLSYRYNVAKQQVSILVSDNCLLQKCMMSALPPKRCRKYGLVMGRF
jgi:hypothetical protein